jgi:hypothetical protein
MMVNLDMVGMMPITTRLSGILENEQKAFEHELCFLNYDDTLEMLRAFNVLKDNNRPYWWVNDSTRILNFDGHYISVNSHDFSHILHNIHTNDLIFCFGGRALLLNNKAELYEIRDDHRNFCVDPSKYTQVLGEHIDLVIWYASIQTKVSFGVRGTVIDMACTDSIKG